MCKHVFEVKDNLKIIWLNNRKKKKTHSFLFLSNWIFATDDKDRLWLTKHLRKISPCVYLHITQAGASVCFNLKLAAKYQQRGTAKNLTRRLNASIKTHSYFLSPAHVTTCVYLKVFTLVFKSISGWRSFGLHLSTVHKSFTLLMLQCQSILRYVFIERKLFKALNSGNLNTLRVC